MDKYIYFKTQKRNQAVNDFEKDFYKLLKNAFYGKIMAMFRNRCIIGFINRDDTDKNKNQQSKLTFKGINKSLTNCDSYTFKQKKVLMGKPIYLGFAILEISKFCMYEAYYAKLQPYFGQDNLQVHYIDCDSFLLRNKTKIIFIDPKKS